MLAKAIRIKLQVYDASLAPFKKKSSLMQTFVTVIGLGYLYFNLGLHH